jgi:hypothetical protein
MGFDLGNIGAKAERKTSEELVNDTRQWLFNDQASYEK